MFTIVVAWLVAWTASLSPHAMKKSKRRAKNGGVSATTMESESQGHLEVLEEVKNHEVNGLQANQGWEILRLVVDSGASETVVPKTACQNVPRQRWWIVFVFMSSVLGPPRGQV